MYYDITGTLWLCCCWLLCAGLLSSSINKLRIHFLYRHFADSFYILDTYTTAFFYRTILLLFSEIIILLQHLMQCHYIPWNHHIIPYCNPASSNISLLDKFYISYMLHWNINNYFIHHFIQSFHVNIFIITL